MCLFSGEANHFSFHSCHLLHLNLIYKSSVSAQTTGEVWVGPRKCHSYLSVSRGHVELEKVLNKLVGILQCVT